jgi:hypothetical protein
LQPSESLEESREATPDSDSGYVIATVTTTTTATPLATPLVTPLATPTPSLGLKKPPANDRQPDAGEKPDSKFSFLAELQSRGGLNKTAAPRQGFHCRTFFYI